MTYRSLLLLLTLAIVGVAIGGRSATAASVQIVDINQNNGNNNNKSKNHFNDNTHESRRAKIVSEAHRDESSTRNNRRESLPAGRLKNGLEDKNVFAVTAAVVGPRPKQQQKLNLDESGKKKAQQSMTSDIVRLGNRRWNGNNNNKMPVKTTRASITIKSGTKSKTDAERMNFLTPKRNYQKTTNRKRKNQNLRTGEGQRKSSESDIYFIRLPPAPYTYVDGLGYISRPPSFSSASLMAAASLPAYNNPNRIPEFSQSQYDDDRNNYGTSSLIRPALEFVSNGKPTGVYRWPSTFKDHRDHTSSDQQQQNYRPTTTTTTTMTDSTIIKLDRGPYVFNGKPGNVFTIKMVDRRLPAANTFLK